MRTGIGQQALEAAGQPPAEFDYDDYNYSIKKPGGIGLDEWLENIRLWPPAVRAGFLWLPAMRAGWYGGWSTRQFRAVNARTHRDVAPVTCLREYPHRQAARTYRGKQSPLFVCSV